MVFGKKNICLNCEEKINGKFSFCPHCGESATDTKRQAKDFGLLGEDDNITSLANQPQEGFGITDKLIGSLVNSLMKNLDKQFKNMEKNQSNIENAEIQNFPNGIKIRIGPAPTKKRKQKKFCKKAISEQQLKKMAGLPRTPAKTKVK